MTSRHLGLTQAYISVILMGAGITIIQTLPLTPQTLVWYRVTIALPGLFLFSLLRKNSLAVPRGLRIPLVWVGLLTGAHWVTLFISITLGTVALGMISFYTYPVFATLLEALVQKRKPLVRDIIVSVITLVGVILLTPLTGASLDLLPGVLVGILSASLWAGRIVFIHHKLRHVSGLNVMFWSLVVMAVFLSPSLTHTSPPWTWEKSTLSGVLFLGLFVTAFCHTLFLSSLRHISATLVGQISPIQIVSASLAGWYFLQEPLTPRIVIGGLIVASAGIGVAIFFKDPEPHPKIPKGSSA